MFELLYELYLNKVAPQKMKKNMTNKLENLNETEKFSKICNLPNLTSHTLKT